MIVSKRKMGFILLIAIVFLGGIIPPELAVCLELAIYILTINKYEINKYVVLFFAFLICQGIAGIFCGYTSVWLVAKQLIGITISYLCYFNLVKHVNGKFVFRVVKIMSVTVALISIAQQIAFRIGIRFIYDLSWIVNTNIGVFNRPYQSFSIFSEPSELALVLMPLASVSVYRILGKNKKAIRGYLTVKEAAVILLGFLSSLSSTGLIGLLIPVIFIFHEYKISNFKKILIAIGGVTAVVAAYVLIPGFRNRLDDTISGILLGKRFVSTGLNASSDTLLLNFRVSIQSLTRTYGLGGGLGSHQYFYYGFVNPLTPFFGLNAEDGNSLFIRTMSELGIIGLAAIIYFIVRNICKKRGVYQIISMACLSCIVIHLLRFGHYFNDGLWFILGCYYYCHRMCLRSMQDYEGFNKILCNYNLTK